MSLFSSLGKRPQPPGRREMTIDDALAVLAAAVFAVVGPPELWKMPQLLGLDRAVQAAGAVGKLDANSDPFDGYTHHPVLPHQNAVVSIALQILDALGTRAYAILAAWKTGRLVPLAQTLDTRSAWKRMSWLTRALILLAALLEMWLAATLWERLIGAGDSWSWIVGGVWALILLIGTLKAAEWIHDHRPGLIEDRGLWIAGAAAAVLAIVLTFYAFGLAGGAQADPTAGGATGGGVANTTTSGSPDNDVNWVFLAVYLGAMLFIALTVLFSHVRDLGLELREATNSRLAALDALPSDLETLQLAIELLKACVALAREPNAVHAVVQAYVGAARQELPPAQSSRWDTRELEHCQVSDPAWAADIESEIEALERRAAREA